MYRTRKEKHVEQVQKGIDRDVNYDFMIRTFGVSEKAKEAFRHKPYTVIHRGK